MSEWSKKLGDYTVTLNERNRFLVVELDRDYETFEQASEAIDRAYTAKKAVKKEKLEIQAIHNDGKDYLITGVHAGHGHLITKPPTDRYSRPELYLGGIQWIKDAIAEKLRLAERIEQIDEILSQYRIKLEDWNYSPGKYAEQVESLKRIVADAQKRAAKRTTWEIGR